MFTDVDSLIDFLYKQDGKNIIIDFSLLREQMVYGDLTPELAERIREHYGKYRNILYTSDELSYD